jgi:ABC-type polysaccharide/polyol phosphate transport system ATPase subunit
VPLEGVWRFRDHRNSGPAPELPEAPDTHLKHRYIPDVEQVVAARINKDPRLSGRSDPDHAARCYPPYSAARAAIASVHPLVSTTASHSADRRASLLAEAPAAVTAERVSKTFILPHQRYSTLKERVLHPFAARTADQFPALQDVSLEVKRGEFFGIVGRNGSGKSTLLKCLAGIYAIDAGEIGVSGRLSPFIELGVGFNPELSARDNVMINAIMLGLSRREARARFDEIIEFAELEEFVDLKLKNYSSGMSVRLGFSVAVQVAAEVLVVDEVLAVGDAAFQQKCFEEFDRMKAEGRTILYVTHDMSSVERFCDRGLVLERGSMAAAGLPEEITTVYNELNFGQAPAGERPDEGGAVHFVRGWCEDGAGERIVAAHQEDEIRACFEVEFHEDVEDPLFAFILRNEVRHTIFVMSSSRGGDAGRFERGTRAVIRFAFENRLAPSRYTLSASVGKRGGAHAFYGEAEDICAVIVQASRISGGVVDLPYETEVERT